MEFEFHILAATCMEFLLIIFSAGNNIFFFYSFWKKLNYWKKLFGRKEAIKKQKKS